MRSTVPLGGSRDYSPLTFSRSSIFVVDAGAGHVGRPLRRQEVAHLALRLRPSRLGKVVLHPPAVRFPPLGAVIGAELLARPRAVLEGLCGRLALELQPDRV